jgi:hypothetical protein
MNMFKWLRKEASKEPEEIQPVISEPILTIARTFTEEGRWKVFHLAYVEKDDLFVKDNLSSHYQKLLEECWHRTLGVLDHNDRMRCYEDLIQDSKTGLILKGTIFPDDWTPSDHLNMTGDENKYLRVKWDEYSSEVERAQQEVGYLEGKKKLTGMYKEDL